MSCELCEPAPHPNCETYTFVVVEDPKNGESSTVDVCMEHYDAVKKAISD